MSVERVADPGSCEGARTRSCLNLAATLRAPHPDLRSRVSPTVSLMPIIDPDAQFAGRRRRAPLGTPL